jgi:hypothetical protein
MLTRSRSALDSPQNNVSQIACATVLRVSLPAIESESNLLIMAESARRNGCVVCGSEILPVGHNIQGLDAIFARDNVERQLPLAYRQTVLRAVCPYPPCLFFT